jgi:hypothetical protein
MAVAPRVLMKKRLSIRNTPACQVITAVGIDATLLRELR